jgi:hypothetical protein
LWGEDGSLPTSNFSEDTLAHETNNNKFLGKVWQSL